MGQLPDQEAVITGLFTHQHVTVTAYDAYGNLATTTPFVDFVNFNIDMHGQTCDLSLHLFCGVSGVGAEFENSVTSDDVAYYDPSGGQVTLSATLVHDGVDTATASHTIAYVPASPTANAVAIQDQNIPTLYDIQVPDPSRQAST